MYSGSFIVCHDPSSMTVVTSQGATFQLKSKMFSMDKYPFVCYYVPLISLTRGGGPHI